MNRLLQPLGKISDELESTVEAQRWLAVMAGDAQTVSVRVQVVDMQPFLLDLQVPNYLPARDLTERIARDGTRYWDDGRRRLLDLDARFIHEDETLADLGVINRELVYWFSNRRRVGVLERPPRLPRQQGLPREGNRRAHHRLAFTGLWTICWGVPLSEERNNWTVALPALALGLSRPPSLGMHGVV